MNHMNIDDNGEMDEVYGIFYFCKKCSERNIREGFNFCPNCGIEIKWGKNE